MKLSDVFKIGDTGKTDEGIPFEIIGHDHDETGEKVRFRVRRLDTGAETWMTPTRRAVPKSWAQIKDPNLARL